MWCVCTCGVCAHVVCVHSMCCQPYIRGINGEVLPFLVERSVQHCLHKRSHPGTLVVMGRPRGHVQFQLQDVLGLEGKARERGGGGGECEGESV